MLENKVEISSDPLNISRRVAVFPKETPVRFNKDHKEEKLVFTFPNLIIREVICFQLVVIFVSLLALFIDAPLEGFANPYDTPNPAKAPWYFLGLQELLHSFPPFVAGVIIPGVVVVALVIIPYFDINVKRDGLWVRDKQKTLAYITAGFVLLSAITIIQDSYGIFIPTLIIYGLMLGSYFYDKGKGLAGWLSKKSLTSWIMSWFVLLTIVLTVIGTFFRGAGWAWVWPW